MFTLRNIFLSLDSILFYVNILFSFLSINLLINSNKFLLSIVSYSFYFGKRSDFFHLLAEKSS